MWELAIYSRRGNYTKPLNNWPQEASQREREGGVINHFAWSEHGTQLIGDVMQGGGRGSDVLERMKSLNLASSGCAVGEIQSKARMGNCCRQCGRLHCAYLEVVIRVSGFIFPGIAGC